MAAPKPTCSNVAAWTLRKGSRPLLVGAAPSLRPEKNEIVIKVSCVAINPIDWLLQENDFFDLSYPTIFGLDVAGEVHAVGKGVKGFKKGQRVIGLTSAYDNKSRLHGAFQRFCNVSVGSVVHIPNDMTFEKGVVLPLSITTAAAGLYQKGFLGLPLPLLDEEHTHSDRTILVWGGSSSVGSSAIQLALKSGATVITTASPANFKYCEDLGAKKCFDYHSSSVEDDIVSYLENTTLEGAFHAAGRVGAVESCARIVDRCKGKTTLVTVLPVPEKGIPSSVRIKAIEASSVFEAGNDVGSHIWQLYLPLALSEKKILPLPEPLIIGQGLRSVQHGFDVQRRGVSAAKVVVNDIQEA